VASRYPPRRLLNHFFSIINMNTAPLQKIEDLKHLGLENIGNVYWDLPAPALYEEAIRRHEGLLSHLGPLVVRSGQYTGRLPHGCI